LALPEWPDYGRRASACHMARLVKPPLPHPQTRRQGAEGWRLHDALRLVAAVHPLREQHNRVSGSDAFHQLGLGHLDFDVAARDGRDDDDLRTDARHRAEDDLNATGLGGRCGDVRAGGSMRTKESRRSPPTRTLRVASRPSASALESSSLTGAMPVTRRRSPLDFSIRTSSAPSSTTLPASNPICLDGCGCATIGAGARLGRDAITERRRNEARRQPPRDVPDSDARQRRRRFGPGHRRASSVKPIGDREPQAGAPEGDSDHEQPRQQRAPRRKQPAQTHSNPRSLDLIPHLE